MRILLIARSLPFHVAGGLERHVEDLAVGLAGRGFEVHLLTSPLPAGEAARLEALGVRAHAGPARSARRYSLRWLAGVGSRIDGLLARHRLDMIHAQEFALGFWRPKPDSPPLIVSVHGTITSETPLHRDVRVHLEWSRWPWAVARFGRRLAFAPAWKRALRSAARIVVDSEFTSSELQRIVPDCRGFIRVVPLALNDAGTPVDRAAARTELGWEGIQLITIGRLEWQKGQALALEALAGLRDRPWRYTLAGEGSERAQIMRLIAKLGLEGRVSVVGRVDDARRRAMLAAADLSIWPERTHPAFGLAGAEALSAGTPVAATPRGAVPEVLGDLGGWIARDATAEGMREMLAPLLDDPALLAKRREGLAGRARRRFDFEEYIAAMAAQYRAAART